MNEPEYDAMLSPAILFATEALSGTNDRQGLPAILHAMRVMIAGRTPIERVVGVLHDVVEDTMWRVEDIRERFGAEIADAIDHLSRRRDETYAEYIDRLSYHPLARTVKIHDLNANLARCHELPAPDSASLRRRYETALAKLDSGARSLSSESGTTRGEMEARRNHLRRELFRIEAELSSASPPPSISGIVTP